MKKKQLPKISDAKLPTVARKVIEMIMKGVK